MVFRGIQPCFLHGGSERLACFEEFLNQPKQPGFWRNLRYILYTLWSGKVRFLKGNFCIFLKVSWIFSTFSHRRERICILNWFFCHVLSRFNLSYPRSSKCYAICFLGLTYGFWNKNFQVIKLFICHCSFKTLAQNTIVRLQIVRFLETLQTGCSPFLN